MENIKPITYSISLVANNKETVKIISNRLLGRKVKKKILNLKLRQRIKNYVT